MFIDLHGLTESEAILKIEMALLSFESSFDDELVIVTGNGHVLKGVAEDIVQSNGYNFKRENGNNGAIIVYK